MSGSIHLQQVDRPGHCKFTASTNGTGSGLFFAHAYSLWSSRMRGRNKSFTRLRKETTYRCDFSERYSNTDHQTAHQNPAPDDRRGTSPCQWINQCRRQSVRDGSQDEGHESDGPRRSCSVQLLRISKSFQQVIGRIHGRVGAAWEIFFAVETHLRGLPVGRDRAIVMVHGRCRRH